MNITKLRSLGLQKAVTACIRHQHAIKIGKPNARQHDRLRVHCNDVANELWSQATPEQKRALDANAHSEKEIK